MTPTIKQQLEIRGLRLASKSEPGYWWFWFDNSNNRRKDWVTDLERA